MTKFSSTLALASLVSMGLFTACSDSDSDPTKSELCASGPSQDCMLGVWTFDGVKIIESNTYVSGFDYSANPGSIEFRDYDTDVLTNKKIESNVFIFNWNPSNAHASETDCNPVYGTWSVSGTSLTLKSTVNNTCFSPKTITITPTMTNTGTRMEMQLGRLWFSSNDISTSLGVSEDAQSYYTEVFSIGASTK